MKYNEEDVWFACKSALDIDNAAFNAIRANKSLRLARMVRMACEKAFVDNFDEMCKNKAGVLRQAAKDLENGKFNFMVEVARIL